MLLETATAEAEGCLGRFSVRKQFGRGLILASKIYASRTEWELSEPGVFPPGFQGF